MVTILTERSKQENRLQKVQKRKIDQNKCSSGRLVKKWISVRATIFDHRSHFCTEHLKCYAKLTNVNLKWPHLTFSLHPLGDPSQIRLEKSCLEYITIGFMGIK